MNTPFTRVMFSIIRKDLLAELRSRELVGTMLMFALLSVLIFSFALELDRVARQEAISGVLWVTIIFGSILGLNRSMGMERDNGNMDAMLLAPISRPAIFAGKFLGNLLFTLVVGLLLLPLTTILYNISVISGWMLVILGLGIFGFCVTGTLIATMTVQTRAREALLPIALLPVALPLLLAAVKATTAILNNVPFADWGTWAQILLVIDVVYLVVCVLAFEYVIED
ncbi:MAG: heme exporter protein CcmB [Anaerolineae bacterium]|jgi:heme exporter protein B|nr:heme exporter protein CcmB [Anaerolineae bacterium]